jgi:phage terminase large subunit GpA-like protein
VHKILRREAVAFLEAARAPRVRTLRQWCEQELVLPDGPFRGQRFRLDTQPFSRLWLDLVDSGHFTRFATVGPTQSGKTLLCAVAPVLYHLFELRETVIFGVPTEEMARDKWGSDLLPAIEASRYRTLLPRTGGGSGGGKVTSITFRNGATLRFMSAGGSDKKRAGFTARVLVVTEVDGLDTAGGTSREADKLKQLEGRTRSYGNRKRIYLECTASIPEGRIWTEYTGGTQTVLMACCPGCGAWVAPEREHLTLWQQADELTAREAARWLCPACGVLWDERERRAMNLRLLPVHRGQQVSDDAVSGERPRTPTLGFRWNAFNNCLIETGDIAADEWKASKALDEENAAKEMEQFVWARPRAANAEPVAQIDALAIMRRQGAHLADVLPADTQHVTVGCDVGKYLLHWTAIAWSPRGVGSVAAYGRTEVPSRDLAETQAILVAIRQLQEQLWAELLREGQPHAPDAIFVDSGYMTETVYQACLDGPEAMWPCKGLGVGQQDQPRYSQPKTTGAIVREVGNRWHISRLSDGVKIIELDANFWKSRVHGGLECDATQPGALLLPQADEREHLAFAKHLTAEQQVEEFEAGKGSVIRWERKSRNNHWLDATALAVAAADFVGVAWTPPDPLVAEPACTDSI